MVRVGIISRILFFVIFMCLPHVHMLAQDFGSLSKLLVNVSVANIMAKPQALRGVCTPVTRAGDVSLLVTQALFGEQMLLVDQRDEWYNVVLLEQMQDQPDGQLPVVSGWIQKDQTVPVEVFGTRNLVVCTHNASLLADDGTKIMLSLGTKFFGKKHNERLWRVFLPRGVTGFIKARDVYYFGDKKLVTTDLRAQLILLAKSMRGQPFCWFGRSSHCKKNRDQLTSVGCDGLVNLLYRACGLEIPRFAYEQCVYGTALDGKEVKPGDLIFFASRKKDFQAHHAMVYLGSNQLLEATFQSSAPSYPARVISCVQRLRKPISAIKNGEDFGSYKVYFASYLNSKRMMQRLRSVAQKNVVACAGASQRAHYLPRLDQSNMSNSSRLRAVLDQQYKKRKPYLPI